MHIVAIAWMFVVVLMALAEAMAPHGGVLGAVFTLLLYGVLPLSIVLYILATPARKRARAARELDASGTQPDGGGHAAGDAVSSKREEA